MNKQEILKTLDLTFPCDFPKLHAICSHDPDMLAAVLSLAIATGEKKGMGGTHNAYNHLLHGRGNTIVGGSPAENFSEPGLPTSGGGLDNVVGFVLL